MLAAFGGIVVLGTIVSAIGGGSKATSTPTAQLAVAPTSSGTSTTVAVASTTVVAVAISPVSTPAARPTSTPAPTNSPRPSATPVPPTATPDIAATQTAQALATQTAQARASANAAATVAALPKPIVLTGTGNKVTDKINLNKGVARVNIEYEGRGYFGVKALTAAGDDVDLIANTTTPNYKGSKYMPVAANGTFVFNVEASGGWKLEILDIAILGQEKVTPGPVYKGSGDSAILINVPKTGLTVFKTTRPGKGYFGVTVVSAKNGSMSALLANTTDANYKGEKAEKATADNYFVQVQAEGEWTLEISQ